MFFNFYVVLGSLHRWAGDFYIFCPENGCRQTAQTDSEAHLSAGGKVQALQWPETDEGPPASWSVVTHPFILGPMLSRSSSPLHFLSWDAAAPQTKISVSSVEKNKTNI